MLKEFIRRAIEILNSEDGNVNPEIQTLIGVSIFVASGWAGWAAGTQIGSLMALGGISRFIGRNDLPSAQSFSSALQVNGAATTNYLPLVYGRARLGINHVFVGYSSDKNYLYLVGALCHGEIGGIDEIYFDNILAVDAAGNVQAKYRQSGANTVRLTMSAGGYTNCVAADIGKTVRNGAANHNGILLAYDNAAKTWDVSTNDTFTAEAVTITSGTGAATISSVATLHAGIDTVYLWKYTGTDSQTPPGMMVDLFPTLWDANHKGNGVAYIILRLQHDSDIYQNFPNVTVNVRGRKLYDPRHPANPADFSTNPALALRDYLVSTRYGCAEASASIDDNSVTNAANFCEMQFITPDRLLTFGATYTPCVPTDVGLTVVRGGSSGKLKRYDNTKETWVVVPNSGGDTFTAGAVTITGGTGAGTMSIDSTLIPQNQFDINGIIDTGRTIRQNRDAILASFRANLVLQAGLWGIHIPQSVTPEVFELNTDNIIGDWSFSLKGAADMANIIQATWVNPDNNYQPDTFYWPAPGTSNPYLTADNGHELVRQVQLPYVSDVYQAQRIANVLLEESRARIGALLTANESALQLRFGDVVKLTHPTPGWVQKLFVVAGISIFQNGQIRLALLEYDATAYDAVALNAFAPQVPADLSISVPAPTGLAITSDSKNLASYTSTTPNRMLVSWMEPSNSLITYYELEYKLVSASAWQALARIPKGTSSYYIAPVYDGEDYDVRIRAVNIFGKTSGWASLGHSLTAAKWNLMNLALRSWSKAYVEY